MITLISISILTFFSLYSVINSIYIRILGSIVLIISPSVYYYGFLDPMPEGVALFNGLFYSYLGNTFIETFVLITAGIIVVGISDNGLGVFKKEGSPIVIIAKEYGLILTFSVIGMCFLINMADFISLYLAIEFQSFAVYILASFYKNSEQATSAGLKYFLLGAISSAFILLGCAIVYSFTGLTNLDGLIALVTIITSDSKIEIGVMFGIFFVIVGLLFKVAAAPFHQWAPDVYNGVPTIVTTWLTVIPKISVFMVLFTLSIVANNIEVSNAWKLGLIFCSFLSFVLGTISGLNQVFLKRLLAFSTVAHVGFILLSLVIYYLVVGNTFILAFLFCLYTSLALLKFFEINFYILKSTNYILIASILCFIYVFVSLVSLCLFVKFFSFSLAYMDYILFFGIIFFIFNVYNLNKIIFKGGDSIKKMYSWVKSFLKELKPIFINKIKNSNYIIKIFLLALGLVLLRIFLILAFIDGISYLAYILSFIAVKMLFINAILSLFYLSVAFHHRYKKSKFWIWFKNNAHERVVNSIIMVFMFTSIYLGLGLLSYFFTYVVQPWFLVCAITSCVGFLQVIRFPIARNHIISFNHYWNSWFKLNKNQILSTITNKFNKEYITFAVGMAGNISPDGGNSPNSSNTSLNTIGKERMNQHLSIGNELHSSREQVNVDIPWKKILKTVLRGKPVFPNKYSGLGPGGIWINVRTSGPGDTYPGRNVGSSSTIPNSGLVGGSSSTVPNSVIDVGISSTKLGSPDFTTWIYSSVHGNTFVRVQLINKRKGPCSSGFFYELLDKQGLVLKRWHDDITAAKDLLPNQRNITQDFANKFMNHLFNNGSHGFTNLSFYVTGWGEGDLTRLPYDRSEWYSNEEYHNFAAGNMYKLAKNWEALQKK